MSNNLSGWTPVESYQASTRSDHAGATHPDGVVAYVYLHRLRAEGPPLYRVSARIIRDRSLMCVEDDRLPWPPDTSPEPTHAETLSEAKQIYRDLIAYYQTDQGWHLCETSKTA